MYEDDPPAVKLLAPGLPPGKHDLYCVPISAAAELAALRARVTELEADAARYRWLRDQCSDVDVRAGLDWIAQEHDSIDAGIDAERGVQSAADAL